MEKFEEENNLNNRQMKPPPYDIFPSITSDKISLRQVQTSDIKDLIEILFYDSIQATTLQQATEMQAKINKDYFDGNSIHWGIAEKLTDKIVGTFRFQSRTSFNN